MSQIKKVILTIFLLGLIGGLFGIYFYNRIFGVNVPTDVKNTLLYIPSKADVEMVLDSLEFNNQIKDSKSFLWVAEKMSYTDDNLKPGRYVIRPGWSNRTLINHLRLGNQEPINLVINNVRTLDELFIDISTYLEPSAQDLKSYFTNPDFLDSTNYNIYTLLTHFIPNTYQVYWNSSPASLYKRMAKEKEAYWKKNKRLDLIKGHGLTPEEAYTLASIVEKESNNEKEKPTIAGVYLNRIKRGIPLQADPTVVFAVGDFTIRRVLNKHLEYPSPFNTYLNKGLPPGPICMPSPSSLEGVIHADDHNYLYFCAKPGGKGEHAFAANLTQHNRNARKFHQWLNQQGIR